MIFSDFRWLKLLLCILISLVPFAAAADSTRARDLGIPFEGQPGALNAITDVAGIEVGQVTLIKGYGVMQVGIGPVRTGVTVSTANMGNVSENDFSTVEMFPNNELTIVLRRPVESAVSMQNFQ